MNELAIHHGRSEELYMLHDKAMLQVDGSGKYEIQASLDGEHWSVYKSIAADCKQHSRTVVVELLAGVKVRVVCVSGHMEAVRYAFSEGVLPDEIIDSEHNRIVAESARIEAEQSREAEEAERVAAENARESAEASRVEAEIEREAAEQHRESAERARVQSEASREEAEAQRVNTFETNEEARQRAFENNEYERTPRIRFNEDNEFEASYDKGQTWQAITSPFASNIKIEGYADTVDQLPTDKAIGTVYGVKDAEYTDESPKYRVYVYTSNGWVDNGIFGGISAGVVQETGDRADLVMSQKAVSENFVNKKDVVNDLTTGGADKVLSAEMGKELDGKLAELEIDMKYADVEHTSISDDGFYVCDNKGNVIAIIDKNGLKTVEVEIAGNKIGQLTDVVVQDFYKDIFYITDSRGYIIAKIGKDGIETLSIKANKFLRLDGTIVDGRFAKYELFTLGDSLSQGGVWQRKCAEILGCKFDQAKNIKGGSALSVGGTASYGSGFDIMPWRAKHLIDAGYIEGVGSDAIIILENVNDGARTFEPSAKAFNLSDPIEGYAYDDFGATLLASIPESKRVLDACLRLTKVSDGKNLAITALPTKEGDVTLTVGWAGPGRADYNIHVVPQSTDAETRQYILDRILEYNFSSMTDTLADDGVSIDFSNGRQASEHPVFLEFTDTGNTGMKVSITDTTNAKTSVAKYFKSSSLDEWENVEAWQEGLTFSEGWKTTIEMLQLAYPDAKIIVSMFPSLSYTANDYKLPNGMFDVKSYYDSEKMSSMRVMRTNLSAIADFYNLPFADVFKDCGISISNMLQFYNEVANVHPKSEGQKRWGETISAIIKRFV